MESEIWQTYQQSHPGQVQVLGTDVFNSGTNGSLLQQFRINAGNLTFPLLRDCGDGCPNDTCLTIPYNQRDNYVVINKQGIIRYHADDAWDYGNRYHVGELTGAIDSLVSGIASVGDPRARTFALTAAPSPFHRLTTIELSNPTSSATLARITVHDLAGRRVAVLWDALAAPGITRVSWEGRSSSGGALAPGVYLIRAEIAGRRLTRRVAMVR